MHTCSSQLDQHLVKPLSGFVQVFQSLLDRVFSDPLEDSATWKARILEVLGVNEKIFCSLLSPTWRSILLDVDTDADDEYGIMPDWDLYEKVLRQVVFQLLGLFASRSRPLILVLGAQIRCSSPGRLADVFAQQTMSNGQSNPKPCCEHQGRSIIGEEAILLIRDSLTGGRISSAEQNLFKIRYSSSATARKTSSLPS